MVGGGIMKELLAEKLNQVKLGQVKLNPAMLNRLTLNQVTMGLAFALALVAIVSSVLIAPRSNEQVVELTPLQPAQELQASINPNQVSSDQAGTSVAASSEVREAASLEGQTSAVESAVQESNIQESTLQELPIAEQTATSSVTEPVASSSTTEQAASSSNVPGTIPTRSTEKISETPYPEQGVASKPVSSTTATITETSLPRASEARTEIARKTVTRSSLPLRRDAGAISVQAGAFKSLENAQKLTSRLQAAGIRAGVEKGKTMYRVLVGPYASESDARAAARGVLPLAQ
jgi:cell division protein FtsN